MTYPDNPWPRLIALFEDAIRPNAVVRKNWLFSARLYGARASRNLYSMIESTKPMDWFLTPNSSKCSQNCLRQAAMKM
jgi:hypothetical protein